MILLVNKSVNTTAGSAQSSQDMIRSLVATGNDITLVSLEPYFSISGIEQYQNKLNWITYYLKPERLAFQSNLKEFAKHLYWRFKYPRVLASVKKEIDRLQPKLLIVNSLGSYDLFSLLNNMRKIPSVLVLRESPLFLKYNPAWNLQRVKNAFSEFSHFVFVSELGRSEWKSLGVVNDNNSCYIPNTIMEVQTETILKSDKATLRSQLSLPQDKKIIVCIANISFTKGHDLLLSSFETLQSKHKDAVMLFVGKVKDDNDVRVTIPLKKIDAGKVIRVGEKSPEKALEYLAASDIFVLPSRTEAMPRAVLEAMALKMPVIGSDVGGIPELITHRKEGLIFERENSSDLTTALSELLDSSEKRQEYGLNAYNKYWSQFSREKHRARWKIVIDKLLKIPNPAIK